MPKGEPMSYQEQLNRWVAGESIHNSSSDECCPDFSCCKPENAAPIEERIAFRDATERERSQFLFKWLSGMLKGEGFNVIGSDMPADKFGRTP